ncbi:MAG: XTP/dITP diphosphatase [Candidatus Omnitrophica bacterium]|nr:XTP/dITP diphosphatase [Candidatus Omnitrophota bacterium]
MKQKLLLASCNKKKLKELRELFDMPTIEIVSLNDFDDIVEVQEDGETFEENALKKAQGYARQTRCLTLADDSGLCVDHLGGKPGVFSARYAGVDKDDKSNCNKVLTEMKDCPRHKRTARFVAVVALAEPNKVIGVVRGECEGEIAPEACGNNGFGYDPIFYYRPFGATFGEIDPAKKHAVSHRAQALEKAKVLLQEYMR